MHKALSKDELNELHTWLETSGKELPEAVEGNLRRLLAVYFNLAQGASRAKATLMSLRLAMGFVPKSERGKSIAKH